MTSIRNSTEWQSFPIDRVKPYPGHARSHNKRQIDKPKQLIRHYGQVIPVVVDRDGVIVDGHAVWKAMRELGSGEIAAAVVANRTDPEIKALRFALNRLPADAAWDNDRLREELEQLVSLSFDLELTGFDAVVSRPMDVVVLNCWVTDMNARSPLSASATRSPPPNARVSGSTAWRHSATTPRIAG